MHGQTVRAPVGEWQRPGRDLLHWHNEAVFRG
jgi:hypothetical protein